MSMILYLVKMPETTAARIKAHPDLLYQVWDEEEMTDSDIAGLDPEGDKLVEDYLHLGRIVTDNPDRYPWLQQALHGTAQEAAQIAAGLADEGWWREGDPVVTIDHAVAAFYASAGGAGHTVIGGIG